MHLSKYYRYHFKRNIKLKKLTKRTDLCGKTKIQMRIFKEQMVFIIHV